jgi:hypothetical protein
MDRADQTASSLSPHGPASGVEPHVEQRAAKRGGGRTAQTRKFLPLELIERTKDQIRTLTGAPVESVSAFNEEDAGWQLILTVVELRRIPAGTDVLAEYDVRVGENGEVVSYRRQNRYFRNQVGTGG